eukprot:2516960-Prymnesium_polylepis.2
MFLPLNRSPSGNGRKSHLLARRCTMPTSAPGLAAKRTIARDDCCTDPSPSVRLPLDTCRPSMRLRSASGRPSSFRSRSSFIDVMGSGHFDGMPLRKFARGSERRVRYDAKYSSV